MSTLFRPARLLACLGATMMFALSPQNAPADTSALKIKDDPQLSATLAQVREQFMKDKPFDRLSAAILVRQSDGSWARGSFEGNRVAYPASCVKLAYLAAAMHWCAENGRPYDYLDHCVRPMIVNSDNVQTGVVVDAITSTTNIDDCTSASDPRYASWFDKRLYTERFLASRGLLANQKIANKTYPTNSGEGPSGAEQVARVDHGMNQMQPEAAAQLMLELVSGAIEPKANAYVRELLSHDRWQGNSFTATGFPPGSLYLNKPGLAYDTLEDIAYVKMPNGREFILAVFTNAFRPPYSNDPKPYYSSILGVFAEKLIEQLGLEAGNPPKIKIDSTSPDFHTAGDWKRETTSTQYGPSYLVSTPIAGPGSQAAQATWDLKIPEAGRYEVCVWYPQAPDRSASATYAISSAEGTTSVTVNQRQAGGRWRRLGDFSFEAGKGTVSLLADAQTSTASTVAADAIRAIKWPKADAPKTSDNKALRH